ncbi:FAD-binding domain-containing protein [Xylariaceae sp. AK1471]|nr:FAD-binding domain-containing protein [Xylariaceae sp. AK1471]
MADESQPVKRGKADKEGQENNHVEVTTPFHILTRDATGPETFKEAVWGRVFNRRRDTGRVPRAVVQASCVTHVKEALELANRQRCRISVRSGGHSWAAWSVRQDAILIDLGNLRHMTYDERTKVVSCSPSVTGEELNNFLKAEGRMFAGGHCPEVGLGGFLLQGGMGWNCKNWGWACESIIGIDVVTADARELYCSNVENSDLFWAARGAGPGFPAIVMGFHLLTRPLLQMYNCVYVYPKSMFRTVLQWVIDTSPTADTDTEMVCVSKRTVDGDDIEIIAGFLSFKPSKQDAEEAMRRVHDSRPAGAKVEIFCDPTDLACQYTGQREEQPTGYRYCSENAYISDEANVDVPGVLEKAFTSLPTQKSFALYFAMNPISRRPLPDMALSMHSDHYFALYTIWDDAADDARCTAWVRDIVRGVERHSAGSYMGDADFQHRTTRFWSREHGKRLRAIRQKWDPEGRICGYLDLDDSSGVQGLKNEFEWIDRVDE